MAKRTTLLTASLCLAAAASAFGQGLQGTGFVFQLPGAANPTSNRLIAYIADRTNLNPDVDLTGPQGTYKVIPTPSGTKFYLLNSGTLQSLDANLSTFRTINGISSTIKDAQVTANGQYLIVQADTMYVLNTQTDAVVATGLGLTQTVSAFTIDPDSTYLYVSTLSGFAGSLNKISLSNFQPVGTPLQLPFIDLSLAFSPGGLLYAIFENRILEIDPVLMQANNPTQFQFSAKPGPIHFSPNGKYGYFINTNPTGPGLTSMVRINITDHTTLEWPPFNPNATPPTFDDIYVASDTRIFTYSPVTETVYDIDPTTFEVTTSALHPNPLFTGRVLGIAISDEVPSSRFLYALMDSGTSGSLVRVDLSTNTVSATTLAATNQGKLQYVSIPPSAGATSLLLTNGTQVLRSGAQPLPLIARVLDALGRPVFNQPVTFTTDPTNGATIAQSSLTTNASGRVTNTVTIPTTPGTYVITAQAGSATASFQLTIPGSGGGTPGGPELIHAVIGDGTLLSELNVSTVPWAPLTILVTDETGAPRPGVAVSFTLNKGIGGIRTPSTVTDDNGMASTIYFTAPVPTGFSFINNIVRATVDTGFVDFNVTVFHQEQTSAGVGITPEISLPTPVGGVLTIGRGQTINGAITARIVSSAAPQVGFPITNVGLRIGDGVDPTINGQGSCVGNTLSDNTGIATCNYKASCMLGQITENVVIGEFFGKPVKVTVVPGAASQIGLSSGDLQSGKAGQTLADLVGLVTDGCGGPIIGANVTMTLVSGSATLTPVKTQSDGNGLVSARVMLGSTPGPVQVRFTLAGATPLLFNLTNNVVVGKLIVSSGDQQSALVNQQFGAPVVFQLLDNGNVPISGALVNFSVSGPGSISPLQGMTGTTDGKVSTTVTANSTIGTITVTATYNGFSNSATLQVRPQGPQISNNTFFNDASLAAGMVPCGLTVVIAPGIAPTTQGVLSGVGFGPMPYGLGDVQSIYVNNVPAPIQSVANINGKQQATFQTPCETSVGSATVRINVGGTESTATGVPVFAAQPGIFTFQGPDTKVYGAVIRIKDGTYITPSNYAPVGEHFYLVVTGLGQTNPGSTTNSSGTGNVIIPATVGLNGAGMVVDSARPLPGYTGVYLIEFEIPLNAPQGPDQGLDVFVNVNGQLTFGNHVLIPGVGPQRQ